MSVTYKPETPDDVKSAKGIHLLTQSTPNGQKVQIFLEELKIKYGVDWTTTLIDIDTNVQKEDWFIALNPNGRIPVIVDNTISPPFSVHETASELVYLQKKFDKDHVFGFTDPLDDADLTTWLFFWHGSGAPYMGNTNYFTKNQNKNDAAIQRFRKESLRVFGVLDIKLSGKYEGGEPKNYLVGKGKGKYSIADIGAWPWVKNWKRLWTDEERNAFPHVQAWIDRIAEREAVKIGTGEKYDKVSK